MIIKTVRLALAVSLVTLAYASAAYGEALTFSSAQPESIELISEGSLTVDEGGPLRVVCPVTLSGSMSATSFAITEGTRFGSLSSSTLGSCTGGSLTFLSMTESPYPLTYQSFLGTLPELTGIKYRIGGVGLQVTAGITCLFTGELEALMALAGVDAWLVEPGSITSGTLRRSGGFCPESVAVTGRLAFQGMQAGVAPPIANWTPGAINFGRVALGRTAIRTAVFRNISRGEITITEVRSTGSGCAPYSFTNGGGALAATRTLREMASISISAMFAPITTRGRRICGDEIRARLGAERGRQVTLNVVGVAE